MTKWAEKEAAQLALVQQALAHHPEGLPFELLQAQTRISETTLRRRLPKWEGAGFVRKTGVTRANRYVAIQPVERGTNGSEVVPLSEAGRALTALLGQPAGRRPPVGYNTAFLHKYQPNESTYFSHDERTHLRALGTTTEAGQPAGTYTRQIRQRLLIDLSYNSSRLEGNTYSLPATQQLLQSGVMAQGKAAEEAQMILNHKGAIEFLLEPSEEIGVNRYTVLSLHALLSDNLLPEPAACGRLRQDAAGISGSVYTPPGHPQQIEGYFETLLEKAAAINDPFEQAFFLMVQLPYLQPFDGVNNLVSRLAANIGFNRHNLVPLSFVDVPPDVYVNGLLGVYELNRVDLLKDVFLFAYERSAARYGVLRQTLGEPDPFRLQYREALKAAVRLIVVDGREAGAVVTEADVATSDRERFATVVATELESLHEGNIARYRLTPGQFAKWRAGRKS